MKLITDSLGKEKFKFNEKMSEHTVLQVGGPSKLFFVATTQNEIIKIVEIVRELRVPFVLFGTGSKMMISDNGFDGVVVKNRTKNISIVGVKGKVSKSGIGVEEALVEIESGVSINKLIEFLTKQNLSTDSIEVLEGSLGGNLITSINLQKRCKNIKVINQDNEIEQIEAETLSLRKHIILSAVVKFKSKA